MSTLYPFLTAIGIIITLMVVWVAVQLAYRKHFPEAGGEDQDALAGRAGCAGCALDGYCEIHNTECEGDPSSIEEASCAEASNEQRLSQEYNPGIPREQQDRKTVAPLH